MGSGEGVFTVSACMVHVVKMFCLGYRWRVRHVYVFGSGWHGGWVRGLGLVFTNPVGRGGVFLCFGCGGVGREWVGALTRVLRNGFLLYLCELGV